MKKIRSFGLLIFVGVMWWGLVYPELCFMEGTYEVAAVTAADALEGYVTSEEQTDWEEPEDSEGWERLFEVGPKKIVVKSKIMRNLIQ